MVSPLLCTMLMTLCVDIGWKTLENGERIFVIQAPPEQGEVMLKNGQMITSAIPLGCDKVGIQIGTEKLDRFKSFEASLVPTSAQKSTYNYPSETTPTLVPTSTPESTPTPTTPPSPASSFLLDTPSLNQPTETLGTSPLTPSGKEGDERGKDKDEDKDEKKDKATKAPASADSGDSYLTTAIASWIVSAGLFALVIYLGWIHLDMRRRYQALLMASYNNPALGGLSPNPMEPILNVGPPELNRPSKPVELSKPVTLTEATRPSEAAEPALDDESVFDKTDRLLQNTNWALSHSPQKAKRYDAPRVKREEPETVYELPETSDEKTSEFDEELEEELEDELEEEIDDELDDELFEEELEEEIDEDLFEEEPSEDEDDERDWGVKS